MKGHSNKGWKAPKKLREKMSEARKGIKPSAEATEKNRQALIALDRTGSNNPMSKVYYLQSPEGEKFEIKGRLRKFCDDQKLRYASIGEVTKGLRPNYNGWTAYQITK